jgi:hypothetical protein
MLSWLLLDEDLFTEGYILHSLAVLLQVCCGAISQYNLSPEERYGASRAGLENFACNCFLANQNRVTQSSQLESENPTEIHQSFRHQNFVCGGPALANFGASKMPVSPV